MTWDNFWDESAFDEQKTDWKSKADEVKIKIVEDFTAWKGKMYAIYAE
jgi:hypothetical protein